MGILTLTTDRTERVREEAVPTTATPLTIVQAVRRMNTVSKKTLQIKGAMRVIQITVLVEESSFFDRTVTIFVALNY